MTLMTAKARQKNAGIGKVELSCGLHRKHYLVIGIGKRTFIREVMEQGQGVPTFALLGIKV